MVRSQSSTERSATCAPVGDDGGVVVEDVEPTEALHGVVDRRRDVVLS